MGLTFKEIVEKVKTQFPDSIVSTQEEVIQPWFETKPEILNKVCRFLKDDIELDFDFCESISGVDDTKNLWVVYHLTSLRKKHLIILKTKTERENSQLPTVMDIWKTADWQEREIYDLYGIKFDGHHDLRRILLPEDWQGHPLRKDYKFPEDYDGIPLR
ncbi:MAG: NADH-quinone oxidoreductase subunit C [Planctomycetes bacterium]|nr:NADH-quinone oxidoreductase subunit C [Planctomycetota bacterium]